MLNGNTSQNAEIGEPQRDISEVYSIRHIRDGIRIKTPEKKTITTHSRNGAALQALSQFAPLGVPTLRPDSQMALVEAASGRIIEFHADELVDIAALMAALCIGKEQAVISTAIPNTPLPDVLFKTKAAPKGPIPEWITADPEFKRTQVIDDGDIVLDFTPLRMNAKQKYKVDERATEETADAWGYEVLARGNHFGWVILTEPNCFVVTGVAGAKHSKHRTATSAMFRLSSHLQAMEEVA